jgi:hypothetical protein
MNKAALRKNNKILSEVKSKEETLVVNESKLSVLDIK